MKEIYDSIVYIYFNLSFHGINVISIALTIFIIDFLKTKIFKKINFYNKNKDWVNLSSGLLLSLLFAFLFYIIGHLHNVVLTTIIGFALSISSHQIIKTVVNLLPIKKESK